LGWDGLCSSKGVEKDPKTELENCRKAEALQETASDYSVMGQAQEKLGDECGAAESYRKASVTASGTWTYLESMGKASLKCGNLPDASAALEAAIDLEKKVPSDEDLDDDEKKDAADALSADRELLIVTFDRMKKPELAKAMCSVEHPKWKGCACGLNADGNVECEER
jgi:tetratricopeptide (TPR) repeat protein